MRLGMVRGVLWSAILALVAAGFAVAQEGEKTYADGPDGLKDLWADVMAKAQADQEDAVRGALEKMVMTADDFSALFGDKGADLAAKYAEKYAKHWPNEAKNIVAKVKERGYDDVEVSETTASAEAQTGSDKKVIAALKEGTKMYNVRLKKKGEKTGLRYDSFFYVNGSWKTGLKLAKLFDGGGEKPAAPGGGGSK